MVDFKNFRPKKTGNDFFEKFTAEAKEWCDLLSARLKDIPGNHLSIGKDFMQRGLYKEASYRFRVVKWMRPKHVEATALLAECYAKGGEIDKAKQTLAELKQLDTNKLYVEQVKNAILEATQPKPKPTSEPVPAAETTVTPPTDNPPNA